MEMSHGKLWSFGHSDHDNCTRTGVLLTGIESIVLAFA